MKVPLAEMREMSKLASLAAKKRKKKKRLDQRIDQSRDDFALDLLKLTSQWAFAKYMGLKYSPEIIRFDGGVDFRDSTDTYQVKAVFSREKGLYFRPSYPSSASIYVLATQWKEDVSILEGWITKTLFKRWAVTKNWNNWGEVKQVEADRLFPMKILLDEAGGGL